MRDRLELKGPNLAPIGAGAESETETPMTDPASPVLPARLDLTVTSTGKTCSPGGAPPPTAECGTAGSVTAKGPNLASAGAAGEDEREPGGFLGVNNDDDDNNGTPDKEKRSWSF